MKKRFAQLTLAHIRTLNVFARITIEERHTFFAMLPLGIVLAIVTHATADATRMLVDGLIKMTTNCMIVAITFWRVQKEK